jgi:hypothetical protein
MGKIRNHPVKEVFEAQMDFKVRARKRAFPHLRREKTVKLKREEERQ